MKRLSRRPAIIVSAVLLAVIILLFPPWRARAVRTTTRYAAVAGIAPATTVDTIEWTLSFVPLYSPPRAGLSGQRMRELSTGSLAGDRAARDSLRRATSDLERRLHVPEVLRTEGELWRDSVLTAAGIPASSSYDLTFRLDQRWIAARLVALALITIILDLRAKGLASRVRGW